MAKKSKIVKAKKLQYKKELAILQGRKLKFATKVYNRCKICGRPRGYINKFGMCRICLRELAEQGKIAGIKRSSW